MTTTVAVARSVEMHPVHKALHRPLTVCGVERRLFFLALRMGAAPFNLFSALLRGPLGAGRPYAFAWWATKRDPQMLRILLASSKFHRRYDPAKHTPVVIEVHAC